MSVARSTSRGPEGPPVTPWGQVQGGSSANATASGVSAVRPNDSRTVPHGSATVVDIDAFPLATASTSPATRSSRVRMLPLAVWTVTAYDD